MIPVRTLDEIKKHVDAEFKSGEIPSKYNCSKGIQEQADAAGYGKQDCLIFYQTRERRPEKDCAFSIVKQKFKSDGTPH